MMLAPPPPPAFAGAPVFVPLTRPQLATLDVESLSYAGFVWNKEKGSWSGPPGAPQGKKGLPVVGAFPYWEHPTAEVLLLSYSLPGDNRPSRWRPGDPPPQRLFDFLAAGGHIEFHNAMFEKLAWFHVLQKRHGWPPLDPNVVHCSMATAHVNGYPGSLGDLGAALGTNAQKDPLGKALMDVFSKPRKPTKGDPRTIIRAEDPTPFKFQGTMQTPAALFDRYHDYCDDDVLTEHDASARMEPMTPAEREAWLLDQRMNWGGIAIDRRGVRDCIAVLGQALARYGRECEEITGGIGPSQVQALIGWIRGRGVFGIDSFDSKKSPVDEHLKRDDLPPDVRRVLEIRALVGSAGVKKLYAMENRTSCDNRLRGLFVHHGTRTGRPTGEGVQSTNLVKIGPDLCAASCCGRAVLPNVALCPWCGAVQPAPGARGSWSVEYVDDVLEIMACRSLDMVEHYFGDAVLAMQGCIRGLLIADDGYDLISSDYSAIEAVVAACITGEQWRIDTFKARRDIYLESAAKITGRTYDDYLAYKEANGTHHPDRQKVGKVAELACFAPQTQVLTNAGYVAMVDVRLDHLLWDGQEWVGHRGVVVKGRRKTINLDGVGITPDHLVNLNGFWREAQLLAFDKSSLCQALETGSENLPSWAQSEAQKMGAFSYRAHAARRPMSSLGRTCVKGRQRGARRALAKNPPYIEKTFGDTLTFAPTRNIGGDYSTEYPRALRGVDRGIRPRARPTTRRAAYGFTSHGLTGRKDVALSSLILSRSPAGTNRRWNWIGLRRTEITNRGTSGSSRKRQTKETGGQFGICKPLRTCTSDVYDIAHAGPRNRFTIKTDSGHLIVHNCGFGGWVGSWRSFDPDSSNKTDGEIMNLLSGWRDASPRIVEMWGGQRRKVGGIWCDERYGIEGAFINAVENPGCEFWAGPLSFRMTAPFGTYDRLKLRLPSGRELTYHQPMLTPSSRRPGTLSISYMTDNSNPKYGALGWVRMETWGSRIFENSVQAIAHCIMRYARKNLFAAGYNIVQEVYDEAVSEVPHGWGSIDEFESIMGTLPHWARLPNGEFWPIRASGGWRGRRYRKD